MNEIELKHCSAGISAAVMQAAGMIAAYRQQQVIAYLADRSTAPDPAETDDAEAP